jgi:hypothetical protein
MEIMDFAEPIRMNLERMIESGELSKMPRVLEAVLVF